MFARLHAAMLRPRAEAGKDLADDLDMPLRLGQMALEREAEVGRLRLSR